MPGFSYFLFSLITTEIQYSKVTVTWFLFFSVAMRLEWKILRNEASCSFYTFILEDRSNNSFN